MSRHKGSYLAQILGSKLILDLNSDFNGSVSAGQWNDTSGRGNHVVQASAGLRPTVVASVMDGHASVRFDGVDDVMSRSATFSGTPATGSRMFGYCVFDPRWGSTAYDSAMWALSTDGTEGINSNIDTYVHSTVFMRCSNGVLISGGADPAVLAPRLFTSRYDSPNCQIDVNGTMLASAVSSGIPHGGATYLRVGARWDDIYYLSADYFRLIFAVNPSAAQHTAVMAYLRLTYPTLGLA